MSTQTPGPANFRHLWPSLLLNALLPFVVYQVLTAQHYSLRTSLSIAAVLPAIGTLIGWARTRRADVIGIFSLAVILLGLVTSLISGNPTFLLIKESFITGLVGLLFLGSLLLPRPLTFYFGRQFVGSATPEAATRYEALWQYPHFRSSQRIIASVWGFALIAEASLRLLLVFLLPIPFFLLVSPAMAYTITVGLVAWTLFYARGTVRQAADVQAQRQRGAGGDEPLRIDEIATDAEEKRRAS